MNTSKKQHPFRCTSKRRAAGFFLIATAMTVAACANTEFSSPGASEKTQKLSRGKESGDATGALKCLDTATLAQQGQSIDIAVSGASGSATATVEPGNGTATIAGSVLTYVAPASVSAEKSVVISVADGKQTATCTVKLIRGSDLLVPDDDNSRAILANVYDLNHKKDNARLADLTEDRLRGGRYMLPNIDVPVRSWDTGFPGATDLQEYFGIRFTGTIHIPKTGNYSFKFVADDGAALYIDGALVLNNDGLANRANVASRPASADASLTEGPHKFRVDYFQGPRNGIALQLFWKTPENSSWTIVPASELARP